MSSQAGVRTEDSVSDYEGEMEVDTLPTLAGQLEMQALITEKDLCYCKILLMTIGKNLVHFPNWSGVDENLFASPKVT